MHANEKNSCDKMFVFFTAISGNAFAEISKRIFVRGFTTFSI